MRGSDFLVSVIIPTYNYEKFISEAINSVLSSDFDQRQIEIIVVDDGSKDNTLEVVQRYGDKVKLITQKNYGKAWATKVGIDCAQGKYLFNLDADDLFLPSKIKKVVEIFEKDKEIIHVAHPAIYWNADRDTTTLEVLPDFILERKILGREVLSYFYIKKILFGGGSTFAACADALNRFVIPKEVDMYIDEYLVLFTMNQGYSFFIDRPLSIWRIHGENFSQGNRVETSKIKGERSKKSLDAVLARLMVSEFEEDIKKLYGLKAKVLDLVLKEQADAKSLTDVLDIWLYILGNFGVLNKNTFKIIKNYTVLNRSLPTSLIQGLKQAKVILRK